MRVFFKICVILTSLLCVFSCEKDKVEMEIATFVVSGTAYDIESGDPLSNITVHLMGYPDDDYKMEKNPVCSETAYTDLQGKYKITVIRPSAKKYFKILAQDKYLYRDTTSYQSSLKYLYIGDGTAYNERTKTYELKDIDFYLNKN